MFSELALAQLATRKVALRQRIANRRIHCAAAAARVAQPLAWLDRMISCWQRLKPYAEIALVPLGVLAQRAVFRRSPSLGWLMRLTPLFFAAKHLQQTGRKQTTK